MSLRRWALKPGELRPLGRDGLLLLAARCALRVAPWRPPAAARCWRECLAFLVAAAGTTPVARREAVALARPLADLGATACTRLEATDEPRGRCLNYAAGVLSTAVEATAQVDRTALVRDVIEVAKLAGSIPAVLAHAGRVPARAGQSPVDLAAGAAWAAMRADVAAIAAAAPAIVAARAPVRALAAVAPLWPGGTPAWATARARGAGTE